MDPITCLAIASAVTSLIQANNSSDGGIGSLLAATLENQRTMAKQLDSIQRELDLLLSEVLQFDEKLKKAFHEDRVRVLRSSIGEVAILYREWNAESAGYHTYAELQNSNVMRGGLIEMRRVLDSTMAKLEKWNWFDSITVMHIYLASNLSLAIRSGLGEPLASLAANAQRFLNFLARAEDPGQPGSILSELAEKRREFDALRADGILHLLGLFAEEFPEGGSKTVLLYPPVRLIEFEPFVEERMEMTGSGLRVVEGATPEAWGLGFEYQMSVEFREVEVSGVKQYEVDEKISWLREQLDGDDHRLTDMTFQVAFDFDEEQALAIHEAVAVAKLKKAAEALSQYNAVIAGIGMCVTALANAAATRQSILNSFGGGQLNPGSVS